MLCVVDCRCINLEKNHGISRYTYEIIKNAPKNIKQNLILIADIRNFDVLTKAFEEVMEIVKIKSSFLSPYENIEIPNVLKEIRKRTKEEIAYFSPSFSSPPIIDKRIKKYITIHDLMHLDFYSSLKNKVYYSTLVKYYINTAVYVFTVSNYSKEKIINYYGNSEKIKVIYPGIDVNTFRKLKDEEIERLKDVYSYLPEKFFLFIGNNKKHKNFSYAYELYKCLKRFYPGHKLISNVWDNESDKDIIRLEKLDDNLLCFLYNRCEAFLYPSLYEGFGLPPLEALACGAKVIASKCASLPEVLGEHAIYIDVLKSAEENAFEVVEKLTKLKPEFEVISQYISKYNWRDLSRKIFDFIFS
ncbi:glycosyltransferase family 4 protein [Caldicellulosiruptor naganoensis]|uniref:Glycosyltransferase family 4 protein n=1 Tax=Caldicellulosiruptor naganoensis TaxID=29324 RepID=A0ABY7BFE2_9FIRM|nr:glycosyltransferase family 1 protein [Caldicellulosiruptor naganoensis]WAM31534.1 glycosyltransferase family 4 protein [Caldicellulosiruptor naganoensis]